MGSLQVTYTLCNCKGTNNFDMANYIQNILKDIRVDLTEEFDRNFERKSFFSGKRWAPVKKPVSRGSLLNRTGAMRSSIKSKVQGDSIVFSSSKPYTGIHNDGGEIKRTSKKGKSYTIKMPQRQFIGNAPEVNRIIQENIGESLPEFINEYLQQQFNNSNNG